LDGPFYTNYCVEICNGSTTDPNTGQTTDKPNESKDNCDDGKEDDDDDDNDDDDDDD
jgi:hypothetical protein